MPRRELGVPFAVTRNGTLAAPSPLDRSGTIHDATLRMLQVHSRVAVMATFAEPPVWENEADESVAETEHFSALGAVVELDEAVQPLTKRTSTAHDFGQRRIAAQRASALPDLAWG